MNMPMGSALPDWITPVAWTYITLSLVSAALIASDIFVRGNSRPRDVGSELVWISSALYLGPLAIPAYARWGRKDAAARPNRNAAVATLPGGGASAVAHLVAVPVVVAIGWTIAGLAMWPMIIVIFLLATVMLAVYERTTTAKRRSTQERAVTIGAALVIGAVTVAAFDIGMVGWMLVLHFNDLMPPVSEGSFWFLMQVGVIAGLATGFPVVRWLVNRRDSVVPA